MSSTVITELSLEALFVSKAVVLLTEPQTFIASDELLPPKSNYKVVLTAEAPLIISPEGKLIGELKR